METALPGPDDSFLLAFAQLGSKMLTTLIYQGYDAEHRDIDLLRLKNFTIGRKLTDQEVVGNKGLGRVAELISVMVPFVSLP